MKHYLSEHKLKNGSKLLAIDVPNSSSAFFSSVVRAGDYFAPSDKWELPHLLEHLAFLGNQKYPSQSDFMFEIEKNGAYQNATTGVIFIRYFYITGQKELADIIKLGLAQLNRPLFKIEDIEAEKEVVRNELNRRFDKNNFLVRDANELKINKRLVATKEQIDSLENITREDIVEYYEKTHTADNTDFILAGDLGNSLLQTAIEQIEKGLLGYPKGEKIEDPDFLWGDYKKHISAVEKLDAKQDYFSFYFISNSYTDEMVAPARVLHTLYNAGFYARLPSKVRRLGLSYSTHSGVTLNPQICKFYIEDQVHPRNTLRLFEECLKELKDLAEGNYSEAELERAKGYVRGSAETYYQLPQHFVSWYEYDYMMRGKIFNLADYFEEISAVDRGAVAEAAAKLINEADWTLSILGKDIGGKEKAMRQIVEKYFY